MKPEPLIAMALLLLIGLWLVLQPTLRRGRYDLDIRVGSTEILLVREPGPPEAPGTVYRVVAPPGLAGTRVPVSELDGFFAERIEAWESRPGWARTLLGFLNITSWGTFGWVAVGLVGQAAFFARMLVQWVVSERTQVSTVPVVFWWLSFLGGVCLFAYFVWRKDAVGVLGQATGVVIYARNLRLISKERRRTAGAMGADTA